MSTTAKPRVACSLSEEAQRLRLAELREGMLRLIHEVRELPDGLAFRFDRTPQAEEEVRAFIDFELGCCSFARYEVRRDEAAALWLEIRGPDGTRDLLEALVPPGLGVTPADSS